jgi:hypothetical protein
MMRKVRKVQGNQKDLFGEWNALEICPIFLVGWKMGFTIAEGDVVWVAILCKMPGVEIAIECHLLLQ